MSFRSGFSARLVRAAEAKGAPLALLLFFVVSMSIWEIARYGAAVRTEIESLAIANSDSQQWSLAQLEVEFDQMRIALLMFDPDDPVRVREFSQRFDVFYSRVETVMNGDAFGRVFEGSSVLSRMGSLREFTVSTAKIVDAGPQAVADAHPPLSSQMADLALNVRAISLQGIREFAVAAQDQRERVYSSLVRLAAVAGVLVTALSMGLFGLWYLWQFGARQTRSLRSAKLRFEAVIDTALDAVVVVDQDARVVEFNPAATTIFGYSTQEAIGRSLSELIVPDHLVEAHEAGFKRYRDGGTARVVGKGLISMEARRKNGELFPVELSISSIRLGNRELFVSYMRDITRRVEAENDLISARDQAMESERAKAAFVAVMSHEIRTPLNGLLGTLENLKVTHLTGGQKRYVQAMEYSGAILLGHVNDVLDVEKLEAGKFDFARVALSPYELANRIVETVSADAQERGNRVLVEAVGDVPEFIVGDPARILQILMNLVGNANRFTEDGSVTIEIEFHNAASQIEYRVIDTGVGIPEGDVDRVFEDFVTISTDNARSGSGTGLGLGIARRVVRAMGGQIGVESEVGEGSVFWFSIPADTVTPMDAGSVEAESGSVASAARSQAPLRVLVVEDNAINRDVLCEMLMRGGHSFEAVVDGAQAVRAASSSVFDVILMDLNMPVLNGTDATRIIREGDGPNATAPIIAVTANTAKDITERLRAEGFSDVIIKPITKRKLDEVLQFSVRPGSALSDAASGVIVNEEILSDLGEALGADRLRHTCERFVDEGYQLIAEMRAMIGQRDVAGYAKVAHKFAGSAALVGANSLMELLLIQEQQAHTRTLAALTVDLSRLEGVFAQTCDALEARLAA